jgi:hypothetical protein
MDAGGLAPPATSLAERDALLATKLQPAPSQAVATALVNELAGGPRGSHWCWTTTT